MSASIDRTLQDEYPDIAAQADGWDPRTVPPKTTKKLPWVCSKNHRWEASVYTRTQKRTGCPYCAGFRAIAGENSLADLYPNVAKQADGWDPSTVKPKSNQEKPWICERGHKWTATVSHRTRPNNNCPYCSGRRVMRGFNDLATKFPDIAIQAHLWDPTTVTFGSGQSREWICELGHIWTATISDRSSTGNGCPYCSGRRVMRGFNDLATTYPEIAKQADGWDPTSFSHGSGQVKNWICEKGHRWNAMISKRTLQTPSCPTCSGRTFQKGFNDLGTTHPEIANQANGWDPSLYGATSKEKLEWKCQHGHTWKAAVYSRIAGRGCPICANKQVLSGTNDLATTHPEIAREANGWDPTTITAGHDRTVSWICPKGHQYSARPYRRTSSKPTGCPICANKVVVVGINDLATTHPHIACEANGWDPTTITFGSGKAQSWLCPNGHTWKSTVTSRARGSTCTVCSNRAIVEGINDLATTHPFLAMEADGWDPRSIGAGHAKRMAWKCQLGHKWETSVSNRSLQNTGCPVCSGQVLETGFNDLLTRFPEIAQEADGWDPTTINAGTNKKMAWKCSEGHRWKADVSSRTSAGVGCPSCAQYGYNPSKQAWLYLLIQHEWAQLQVGITNDLKRRLKEHEKSGWELIEVRGPMDGVLTRSLEQSVLLSLKNRGAVFSNTLDQPSFTGWTEAWTIDSLDIRTISSLLDLVHEDENR